MLPKKNILGVGITDATKNEILEYVIKNIENFQKKLLIVTPNPEFLVFANKNMSFKNILNKADLASADGIGLFIAGKILGKPLKERFAGTDLVKNLCEAVAEKPITVGFLGGRGGVAEKTAECLGTKCPSLKIAFVGEEWPFGSTHSFDDASKPIGNTSLDYNSGSNSPAASNVQDDSRKRVKHASQEGSRPNNVAIKQFNNETIDILFVALGAPKQEYWISENLNKLPVKVAIGVGGAFDYISGKVPRAPAIIRAIGLEWLFRLMVQPWRFRRQLALLEFIWLVVREKLNKN